MNEEAEATRLQQQQQQYQHDQLLAKQRHSDLMEERKAGRASQTEELKKHVTSQIEHHFKTTVKCQIEAAAKDQCGAQMGACVTSLWSSKWSAELKQHAQKEVASQVDAAVANLQVKGGNVDDEQLKQWKEEYTEKLKERIDGAIAYARGTEAKAAKVMGHAHYANGLANQAYQDAAANGAEVSQAKARMDAMDEQYAKAKQAFSELTQRFDALNDDAADFDFHECAEDVAWLKAECRLNKKQLDEQIDKYNELQEVTGKLASLSAHGLRDVSEGPPRPAPAQPTEDYGLLFGTEQQKVPTKRQSLDSNVLKLEPKAQLTDSLTSSDQQDSKNQSDTNYWPSLTLHDRGKYSSFGREDAVVVVNDLHRTWFELYGCDHKSVDRFVSQCKGMGLMANDEQTLTSMLDVHE